MEHPKDWYRGPGWGHPMTREAKEELRRRLLGGETWDSIMASMGIGHSTIWRFLKDAGGMPLRWKARPLSQLSLGDREEIRVGLDAGESLTSIGRRLGRSASTISREVARNGGAPTYRAWRADRRACELARRPKPSKLVVNLRLRDEVEPRLVRRCSPQQIAARLRFEFSDEPEMWVSYETIYQCLFVQARGQFRHDLTSYLRSRQTRRKPHQTSGAATNTAPIVGMVSISQRPAEADDRAVPGHWEGAKKIGLSRNSALSVSNRC